MGRKIYKQFKYGALLVLGFSGLSSLSQPTGGGSQKEFQVGKRSMADNILAVPAIMGDLAAIGFLGDLGNAGKFSFTVDYLREKEAIRSLSKQVTNKFRELNDIVQKIERVPGDLTLTDFGKQKALDELKARENLLRNEIETLNSKVLSPTVKAKASLALQNTKSDSLRASMTDLDNAIIAENYRLDIEQSGKIDSQIKNSKAIKNIKRAFVIGGVLVLVDIGGHIWAFTTDKPVPSLIPGHLGVELLAKGTWELGAEVAKLLKSPEAQKVLNEKDRGTPEELLNEGAPPAPAKKDH